MATKKTTPKTDRKPREKKVYADPADRFKQLGEKRVANAMRQLRLVGNLSGSGYHYTPAQIDTIRNALQDALDSAMARFDRKEKQNEAVTL